MDKEVEKNVHETKGVVKVFRTYLGKVENKEIIKIRRFKTDTATVGMHLERKVNLEDLGYKYESLQVAVWITMPCYVEEAKEVYKEISVEIKNLVDKEIEEVKQNIRSNNTFAAY